MTSRGNNEFYQHEKLVSHCWKLWVLQKIKLKFLLIKKKFFSSAPLVDSWYLMSSPAPLAVIFAVYLVLVVKVLPRYMINRKPMQFESFIRSYNVFQVIACTFFVEWAITRGKNSVTFKGAWQCAPTSHEPAAYLDLCEKIWYFMMLRLIELTETFVFVLRKKQNQVSPLHLYHHISTVWLMWSFLKYAPSEFSLMLRKVKGLKSCCLV